ncbi:MAG: hypothetical protein IT577_12450 [Verrucomicrobiae bacterium]|nr:hypothetical protein [Verrucomicrobiae bacterium]
MRSNHPTRCPAHADCGCHLNRRQFLARAAMASGAPAILGGLAACGPAASPDFPRIRACGPGSKYVARIRAAFVRRKGEYGMRWPGAVYDGESSRQRYSSLLIAEAGRLGLDLEMRPEPIHSLDEARAWIESARAGSADGLMVMVHDRQEHSWPTAYLAAESGIPSVIYSPLGTSFTTNTARLAEQPGCVVYSTDDFDRALFGMKMLQAGARLRRSRCVVIRGEERKDLPLADTGISLRYVPAKTFLETYQAMPESTGVHALARHYLANARRRSGASEQDVLNGAKSYFVASKILADEEGDAISMDCLGALGASKVSLPCLAWSRMNDDGIPAACEADTGAIASHMVVQALFDRPAFQQDPVAETSRDAIIGAHCSCPTRLRGFDSPPEPFDIKHHHGNRDAVPRTLWQPGQRITCLDILPPSAKRGPGESPSTPHRSTFLISTGEVIENLNVPPAGGCVVSVMVKMDGHAPVLSFPGFHQLFFYGDFRQHLVEFCRLQNFNAQIV